MSTTEVYEYECRRITDADMTETGYRGYACKQPAAAVSLKHDEGVCLSCLEDMKLDGARPLSDPLDVIEALWAEVAW